MNAQVDLHRIVVGYDGSEPAQQAVDWAAAEGPALTTRDPREATHLLSSTTAAVVQVRARSSRN